MADIRVLIVEDDPDVAQTIGDMVLDAVSAIVTWRSSVAGAKQAIAEPLDFVFLDVDVTNGQTFEIGRILSGKGVPFAFVSGGGKGRLPPELRDAPFISKPCRLSQIEEALKAAGHAS